MSSCRARDETFHNWDVSLAGRCCCGRIKGRSPPLFHLLALATGRSLYLWTMCLLTCGHSCYLLMEGGGGGWRQSGCITRPWKHRQQDFLGTFIYRPCWRPDKGGSLQHNINKQTGTTTRKISMRTFSIQSFCNPQAGCDAQRCTCTTLRLQFRGLRVRQL